MARSARCPAKAATTTTPPTSRGASRAATPGAARRPLQGARKDHDARPSRQRHADGVPRPRVAPCPSSKHFLLRHTLRTRRPPRTRVQHAPWCFHTRGSTCGSRAVRPATRLTRRGIWALLAVCALLSPPSPRVRGLPHLHRRLVKRLWSPPATSSGHNWPLATGKLAWEGRRRGRRSC